MITQRISYNTAELSDLTGLSPQQIRRLVRQGKLRAVRIDGIRRQLYRADDVAHLIPESAKGVA